MAGEMFMVGSSKFCRLVWAARWCDFITIDGLHQVQAVRAVVVVDNMQQRGHVNTLLRTKVLK
jgi:hypothetical protein